MRAAEQSFRLERISQARLIERSTIALGQLKLRMENPPFV